MVAFVPAGRTARPRDPAPAALDPARPGPARSDEPVPGPARSDEPVPDQPAPATPPRRRIEVLDGLRLIAALAVVLFHYTAPHAWGVPAATHFGPVADAGRYGWLGVELFFLISGFVICMSAWGRSLGDFFGSRITRLYPAYWVAVLITAAVLIALRPDRPLPKYEIAVNLTMLQRPLGVREIDGAYWTLWTELHFYLLFALVVWRGLTYRRAVLFCILWTAASVLFDRAGAGGPALAATVGSEYSSLFIAGIAMFLMYRFGPTYLLWGIIGVSWARSLLTVNGVIRDEIRPAPAELVHYRTVCLIILTATYLVMILAALGKLSWIRGRWLTVAGALTYPLYLIHEEIGWAVIKHLRDRVDPHLLLPALVGGMLVAAWLIHALVERPLAPRMRAGIRDSVARMRDADPGAARTAVPTHPPQMRPDRATPVS